MLCLPAKDLYNTTAETMKMGWEKIKDTATEAVGTGASTDTPMRTGETQMRETAGWMKEGAKDYAEEKGKQAADKAGDAAETMGM
jgi:hypothetical protein